MTSINKALIPILISIVILVFGVILVSEVVERAIAFTGLTQTVDDPALGKRLKPNAAGHDERGFRNEKALEQANIVALGDSATWGINAKKTQTWPQQLEKLSGLTTYNMGLGFYGPIQYLHLTDEALKLNPKYLIVAINLGSDLIDAYSARDPKSKSSIAIAKIDVIEQKITQFDFHPQNLQEWLGIFRRQAQLLTLIPNGNFWPFFTTFPRYERLRAWAISSPEDGLVYEHKSMRTILETSTRFHALNLNEPIIREGLKITKRAIFDIDQKAKQKNAKLIILLLPTKELIFAKSMQAHSLIPQTYQKMIEMEKKVQDDLLLFLAETNIRSVNPLEILSNAVLHNELVYSLTNDGHPLPHGYYLIASEVNKSLK